MLRRREFLEGDFKRFAKDILRRSIVAQCPTGGVFSQADVTLINGQGAGPPKEPAQLSFAGSACSSRVPSGAHVHFAPCFTFRRLRLQSYGIKALHRDVIAEAATTGALEPPIAPKGIEDLCPREIREPPHRSWGQRV